VDVDSLPEKFQRLGGTDAEAADNPTREAEPIDFHTMTSEFENRLILKALYSTDWNKKEAARMLNMKRTTLLEKIKKRNLDRHKVN
jgi:DNA-binding NtrC family response regulator